MTTGPTKTEREAARRSRKRAALEEEVAELLRILGGRLIPYRVAAMLQPVDAQEHHLELLLQQIAGANVIDWTGRPRPVREHRPGAVDWLQESGNLRPPTRAACSASSSRSTTTERQEP